MKRAKGIRVTTYEADRGFMVEIVDDENSGTYEAWLYERTISQKTLMFGLQKWAVSRKEFLETVERNLPSYINDYEEEYMSDIDWWDKAE